tara:strand:+ start:254 stop:1600 length:1347 start_codon:yes stop_codon:yes gene_type:complete
MSRVFRRPMFRKGGGVNMNGIMSGIEDRQQFSSGSIDMNPADTGFQLSLPQRSAQELGYDFNFAVPTFKRTPVRSVGDIRSTYEKELLEAAGDRGGFDPLTTFLLQYGPQAATKTGGGGLIGNLVAAAKDPLDTMIKDKRDEDAFLRGIRTKAAGAAITTKEAEDKMAMEIENKIETAKADVINKGKELQNKIYANKELTDAERDNLLTQLGANRQLALEKLDIQGQQQKDKIKSAEKIAEMQIEGDKTSDVDELGIELPNYGSVNATKNRRTYENTGLESKAMQTFKQLYKGGEDSFIGSIHGYGENELNTETVSKKWKKENEGNIFYDVTDGKFKQLRKIDKKTYGYKVIDIDDYSPEEKNDNDEETKEIKKTSLSREDAEKIASERNLILIPERPEGNKSKNYINQQKKELGPNAITLNELRELIKKEEFEEKYKNIKQKQKFGN